MNYSTPQLTFFKGADKKKVWFVEFTATNPDDISERRRFQFRFDINKQKTESDKILRGNSYIGELSEHLKNGWNPFIHTPGQYLRQQSSGFINRPKFIGDCLQEAFNLKLKQVTGDESPRTYRYIYKNFKAWLESQYLDKLKPEAFTKEHAMAYGDYLINSGRKGRTFNNYRSVVKVFFNMLVERDIITKNPFSKIKPAKTTEAEIVPFQDMELRAIREYLIKNDYNLYVFCQFIFYLLLRPVEVLWLQVKHVDLTRNKINLPAVASKNRKSRSCNIPPPLRAIIKDWLKYDNVNDYLFGVSQEGYKRRLGTSNVHYKRRSSITKMHQQALDALGFSGAISLYSWKYSGVIAAYLAGISIEEIRIQAGHHSIEITQMYMQKLGLLKPSGFGSVDY